MTLIVSTDCLELLVVTCDYEFVLMINNVETSYFTQLKICYLLTTFPCPSDILIAS